MRVCCGLLLLALVGLAGCSNTFAWPNPFDPGPTEFQQRRAERYDPFPVTDAGPEVDGGRPLQYDHPNPEPERVQNAASFQQRFGAPPPLGMYRPSVLENNRQPIVYMPPPPGYGPPMVAQPAGAWGTPLVSQPPPGQPPLGQPPPGQPQWLGPPPPAQAQWVGTSPPAFQPLAPNLPPPPLVAPWATNPPAINPSPSNPPPLGPGLSSPAPVATQPPAPPLQASPYRTSPLFIQ